MPNLIGPLGLQVKTRAELIAEFTADFQAIYGIDINLESDSPDGQMMNIYVQSYLDIQDLLVQIYNQFDPDLAFGVVLDQRIAINGIQRQAGTFTITPIDITVSAALNLFGVDQTIEPIYTVADNAGNEWQLQVSQTIPAAGTYTFNFQSAVPGAVLTTPNTITVPVTIVLGVTSVNNPTTFSALGINEETDAVVKIRRQRSVSLASQGYLAGLIAALENITGMESVFVYENTASTPDIDGVPGHSIWVIVSGTAPNADVAQAIYKKRNAGCGMFGVQSFTITQVDGSPFTVYWDVVVAEPIFIKFTATSLDGENPPDIAAMRSGLVTSFVPAVNEQVNINDLATLAQAIDNNSLITNAGFSNLAVGPFTNTRTPATKTNQFLVTEPNIIILPMILSPTIFTIAVSNTQQMTGLGGFGALVYSILVNGSGCTLSPTGLYTAGAGPGLDTLRVTDSLGNTADANVTVV